MVVIGFAILGGRLQIFFGCGLGMLSLVGRHCRVLWVARCAQCSAQRCAHHEIVFFARILTNFCESYTRNSAMSQTRTGFLHLWGEGACLSPTPNS